MKKYRLIYILFSLGIFSLFVSCNNEIDIEEDTSLPEGEYPIEFSANNFVMPITTRSLTDNCVVGVSMADSPNSFADTNKAYVYHTSDNTLRAQSTPRYWTREDQVLAVSAYYPANATINNIADQSNSTNYNNYDLLYATNTIAFNERQTKVLAFNHLMSRVEIRLVLKNSYTIGSIKSVLIANTIIEGTLNNWNSLVSAPSISLGGTRGYITPDQHETISDTVKYQAVVFPQTVTGGSSVNLIYVSLHQNARTYQVPLPANLTFEAGKTYTYTIDID